MPGNRIKTNKGTFYLDLADDECWLIRDQLGFRTRIASGDKGKQSALEIIDRLNYLYLQNKKHEEALEKKEERR